MNENSSKQKPNFTEKKKFSEKILYQQQEENLKLGREAEGKLEIESKKATWAI